MGKKALEPDEIILGDREYNRPLTFKSGIMSEISFSHARKGFEPLRENVEQHAGGTEEWAPFARETYTLFYDEEDREEMDEGETSSLGEDMHAILEASPEFQRLRENAVASPYLSRKYTASLLVIVALEVFKDQPDGLGQSPESIQRQIDQLLEMGVDPDSDQIQQLQDAKDQAEAARARASMNLRHGLTQGHAKDKLEQLASEAGKDREQAEAAKQAGFGGPDGDGGRVQIDPALMKMFERQPALLDILKKCGKLREIADGEESKKAHGLGHVVGVEVGDNPFLLSTKERMALASEDEEVSLEVISRILDGRAEVWETENKDSMGKGDLMLLVDRSGSMHGQNMVWARAIAACMCVKAVKEGRRVSLTMFDHTAKTAVCTRENQQEGLRNILELLTLDACGGTQVWPALQQAKEEMGKLREPDVLIVTDGYFWRDEEGFKVVDEVKAAGARMYGVMIGSDANTEFDDIFNEQWGVHQTDDSAAVEIISTVETKRGGQ